MTVFVSLQGGRRTCPLRGEIYELSYGSIAEEAVATIHVDMNLSEWIETRLRRWLKDDVVKFAWASHRFSDLRTLLDVRTEMKPDTFDSRLRMYIGTLTDVEFEHLIAASGSLPWLRQTLTVNRRQTNG